MLLSWQWDDVIVKIFLHYKFYASLCRPCFCSLWRGGKQKIRGKHTTRLVLDIYYPWEGLSKAAEVREGLVENFLTTNNQQSGYLLQPLARWVPMRLLVFCSLKSMDWGYRLVGVWKDVGWLSDYGVQFFWPACRGTQFRLLYCLFTLNNYYYIYKEMKKNYRWWERGWP